jgi:hypothetical protein
MPFPTATKNAWLAGLDYSHISLHDDFPGTTGANELSGGSPAYARKAIVMNAPSGGSQALNAAVQFDVPAGSTVKWLGLWDDTDFLFPVPNGGATPKNFMAIPSTDLIYATGHGWSDTQKIVFFGVPPTGLTEGTTYFVRDSATDTFKVAATSGGSAIDLTAASSFGCVVVAITETAYVSQDTHDVTAGTVTVAD